MKKGFTLIELLAVIVILAIIALIATPIVLNIINDAKESSVLRSADFYIDALENEIMLENMKQGGNFNPNVCKITNGNVLCDGKELTIKVDGEVPSSGNITFVDGKVTDVNLKYPSGNVTLNNKGEFVINYEYSKEKWVKLKDAILSIDLANLNYRFIETSTGIHFVSPRDDGTGVFDNIDPIYYYSFDNEKIEKIAPNGQTALDIILANELVFYEINGNTVYYAEKASGPYYYMDNHGYPYLDFDPTLTSYSAYNFSDGYIFLSDDADADIQEYSFLSKLGDSFIKVEGPEESYILGVNNGILVARDYYNYYCKQSINAEWELCDLSYYPNCEYTKLGNYYYNSDTHSYSESCNGPWTEMGKLTYNGDDFEYGIVEDKLIAYYEKSKGHYLLFYTTRLDNIETYDYKE